MNLVEATFCHLKGRPQQTVFTGMTNGFLLFLFQPYLLSLTERPRVCKEFIQASGQVRIPVLSPPSAMLSVLDCILSHYRFSIVFVVK